MSHADDPPVLSVYGPTGYPLLPATDPPVHTIPATPAVPDAAPDARRAGHAVVLATPAAPPLPAPAAPAVGRWAGRRWRAVAGAAVLMLTAAVLLRCSGIGPTEPPETLVEALFAALSDRAGDRVGQLVTCDGSPLCTAAGLSDGYQPPQQVRIDRAGDNGQVVVHYTIGGVGYRETVGLTRRRQGWLGSSWSITSPPGGHLDLHTAVQPELRVAGIAVTTHPRNGGELTAVPAHGSGLWAPPGSYTITAAGDPIVEPAHVTVTVAGGTDPPPVTLTPTVRADVLAQVERQIRDRIDACARQPRLHPDVDPSPAAVHDCPFRYDSPYSITDTPTWHIDRYPTVTLAIDASTAVTVHTVTTGTASITYRWSTDVAEPRRWSVATAAVPFEIAGTVTATTAGAVTWTT